MDEDKAEQSQRAENWIGGCVWDSESLRASQTGNGEGSEVGAHSVIQSETLILSYAYLWDSRSPPQFDYCYFASAHSAPPFRTSTSVKVVPQTSLDCVRSTSSA